MLISKSVQKAGVLGLRGLRTLRSGSWKPMELKKGMTSSLGPVDKYIRQSGCVMLICARQMPAAEIL